MLDIFQLHSSVKDPSFTSIFYSVLLAFVLSSIVSIIYQRSFQGLSYSRNFIQALILGSLVTCIAMQAIGDNMARGFGMMGALSIIRFRSSVKDPKDIIFIFVALTIGIACGVYAFKIAVVGTMFFGIVAMILYYFPFTSENNFDGLLRFTTSANGDKEEKNKIETEIQQVLNKGCRYFALVTLREVAQGEKLDFAYQIKLKNNNSYTKLVDELKTTKDVTGVTLMLQEATVEI